ncbi:MAG: tRNA preQ1(34) S-adenosylmethionine ribosyltransferase-isomerase QueA [Planctomycetota bacterium]|nr:tRNA preQ1(34) S-adenosylmethionine ribosyltransferase-isomerase QueA [Planctomycetota bacterium]
MVLRLSDFDYPLDAEYIAQQPLSHRDHSRLMTLSRADGSLGHHVFAELPTLLKAGDLLVLNDTRVLPARFNCRRASGARIEGLFLREPQTACWEVLLKNAGRCKVGQTLDVSADEPLRMQLLENLGRGRWLLAVHPPAPAVDILDRIGATPLPPYIRRDGDGHETADRRRYQTVYAARPGAVAAPTAGLHFTSNLFDSLRAAGVESTCVTLHVALGTFAPVEAENVASHHMHAEWYELPGPAADQLNAARAAGRRIVAVGTTAVRVLETAAARSGSQPQQPYQGFRSESGWTDLFIHPPAKFRAVDAMITNFHLPRSTLLMLVAAFCSPGETGGVKIILDAYAEAIRRRYRFYSYGDAMLIE